MNSRIFKRCWLFIVCGAIGVTVRDSAAGLTAPRLWPDYSGITIPPNIAPLNFRIEEPGRDYRVRVFSQNGPDLSLRSADGIVRYPLGPWRELLKKNAGLPLVLSIEVLSTNGSWRKFAPLTNQVSTDRIDSCLVYRRLHPQFTTFGSGNIGIFQRDLHSFDERPVLDLKDRTGSAGHCVNCHAFLNRNPDTFALHLRGSDGKSMLLAEKGTTRKLDLTGGYMSWHPSGKFIVFSRNKLSLFFHSAGETRDVYDAHSDLALYRLDSNQVFAPPAIAHPERQENWPMWSSDGEWLYFASTPGGPLEAFKTIRYDLMRVSYDCNSDTWGAPETIMSSQAQGRSFVQPRPSPDGRFLLFTVCDYGHFPIYQPSSDNWLMDLQTREYRRLNINSDDSADTWHAWSENSRWVVFSSKRANPLLARPFFTHVDGQGNFSKPFILPQEDPAYYEFCLKTFNVPEFVQAPVAVPHRQLFRTALGSAHSKPVDATPALEQTDEAAPRR